MSLSTTRRQIIIRTTGSLLSLGLFAFLFLKQGWREILVALGEISVGTIISILVLMLISRLAIVLRWYSLLNSVAPEISFWQSLKITFAGLFVANFLPTTVGGDVLRVAIIVRLAKDRVAAVTSIAVDRLVGLAGMALMTPIGVAQFLQWLPTSTTTLRLVSALGTPFVFGSIWHNRWTELIEKAKAEIRNLFDSLALWLRRPKALLMAVLLTLTHMVCLFTIIRTVLSDMGQVMGFWRIAGLWSFTYFITLMPFSISGLGLREISIGFIFPELGGISIGAALSLGIILRVLDWVISLPGSLFLPSALTTSRTSSVDVGRTD